MWFFIFFYCAQELSPICVYNSFAKFGKLIIHPQNVAQLSVLIFISEIKLTGEYHKTAMTVRHISKK
jgi:hypothetical protein